MRCLLSLLTRGVGRPTGPYSSLGAALLQPPPPTFAREIRRHEERECAHRQGLGRKFHMAISESRKKHFVNFLGPEWNRSIWRFFRARVWERCPRPFWPRDATFHTRPPLHPEQRPGPSANSAASVIVFAYVVFLWLPRKRDTVGIKLLYTNIRWYLLWARCFTEFFCLIFRTILGGRLSYLWLMETLRPQNLDLQDVKELALWIKEQGFDPRCCELKHFCFLYNRIK